MYIKRNTVLLLVLMLVFVFAGLAMSIETTSHNRTPLASKGVLDLRNYNFAKSGAVMLDGEWEFVSGKLVDSSYFANPDREVTYVPVPSLWTRYKINGQAVPKFQKATYRLSIKLNNREQIMGLKTSNLRMSNMIFVNGKRVGQSGVPSNERDYIQENTPYTAYFYVKDDVLEIIVHIANFDYASGGGIIDSISFGNDKSIERVREKLLAYDWIMIAAFLMMGTYFLGYFWHARKEKNSLFFSLFCFASSAYFLTHGEKVLYGIIPDISYGLFQRMQMFSTVLVGVCLLLYYHVSLRAFSSKKAVRMILGLGIFLCVMVVFPVSINSMFQLWNSGFLFIVIVYTGYIQLKAISQQVTGAMYLVCASLTLLLYFIIDTLNLQGDIRFAILPPALPFFYLLMLSLFMAHRFLDTFRKNEELSRLLLQSNKFKDEFLAKTSHEFRTPLHGIIAIVQTMLNHSNSNSLTREETDRLSLVVGIAKRLSSLVNDILDFAKLRQGELQITRSNVDVYANTYVVSEIFTYMTGKEVRVVHSVPRDLPDVWADENRLRQILNNLMGNAVKFTSSGTIEIRAREEHGFVVVSIADTGDGIEADQLASIFEPYQQKSFRQSNDGVGLGLNITKQLVELQGGEIWVESKPNHGSVFSFTLPIASGEAARSEKNPELPTVPLPSKTKLTIPHFAGNPNGKKVIVADDDHTNLQVLVNALKTEGYSIIAVDHGRWVVDLLEQHSDIDVVLLDIMMPELSGYEVCQAIRESYSLAELPVLMLTAAIFPEDMVAAFQSGANDFLHKPLDLTELKTRVRNLMMMKESARTATKMEVAFLQAQIKPHFLYNVLNSILALSYMDVEKSRKLITSFASFLRESFVFSNTNKLVPLEKELSLLHSYVEIEQARFPEKIQFELTCSRTLNCKIPPLLLQPIVENAIRHGITKRPEGGRVRVTIEQVHDHVVFHIADNGVGMSEKQIEDILNRQPGNLDGVGLVNIIKRIKQFNGSSLSIASDVMTGTAITIRLPYL